MKKELFEFRDYKAYLLSVMAQAPGKGRGMRSAFAKAAGCQLAYLSRVLTLGSANLSLEQAEKVGHFLGHSEEEQTYFLLLLEFARAGTARLREHFERQAERARERHLVLKDRFKIKDELSLEDQAIYYSSWHYAAVHILLTIPELRTKDKISRYLNLPMQKVSEILHFLQSTGLVKQTDAGFVPGAVRIHLGADSPLISKHHANWRMEAIRSLDRESGRGLHYSSVVTLSLADFQRVKAMLVKTIEQAKGVIKDSREEQLCAFSVDFFEY